MNWKGAEGLRRYFLVRTALLLLLLLQMIHTMLASTRRCVVCSAFLSAPSRTIRLQKTAFALQRIPIGRNKIRILSSSITRLHDTTSSTSSSTTQTTSLHVELDSVDYAVGYDDIPVLMLHGLLGNKKNFSSVATSLDRQLRKKRRLIGVDLRNHGENYHDWRDEMSYESMAKDVIAFLDKQNIEKVVLVGHSMGGKVAKTLALMHPHRIEGLVVIDIAPVTYSESDLQWKAVSEIIVALRNIQIGEGVTKKDIDEQLREHVQDPALRAFCLTNYDVKRNAWKVNIDTIASQIDRIAGFIDAKTIYEGDTFFISGGQSRFIRSAHLEDIGKLFPNHMLTSVRGVGHWVHAEAPDDTVALLKKYLDR